MEATERYVLPMIIPGQAQKELFHNEALQLLDLLVAPAVEAPPANDPPPSPTVGSCFLVGDSPTGEWAGHAGHLAGFSQAGWRFITPQEGLSAYIRTSGNFATFGPLGWEVGIGRLSKLVVDGVQVVGAQGAAIADPAGGATVDSEARAALSEMLGALRLHGLIAE